MNACQLLVAERTAAAGRPVQTSAVWAPAMTMWLNPICSDQHLLHWQLMPLLIAAAGIVFVS